MTDFTERKDGKAIAARSVDTIEYEVLKELPNSRMVKPPGKFKTWPQGETFAHVDGLGLGVVRNAEINEWEEQGLIKRTKPTYVRPIRSTKPEEKQP